MMFWAWAGRCRICFCRWRSAFFTFEQISYLVDADAGKTPRLYACWIMRCSWPISRT